MFGPGQGSTLGPFLWLIMFSLMVSSLSPDMPSAHFTSADHTISSSDIGEAFVDDSFLGVTAPYQTNAFLPSPQAYRQAESQAIASLNSLAQQWERLLFATGGALCPQKSFWYLISWTWSKTGTAHLATTTVAPGSLHLTSGSSTDTIIAVPRIEPSTTYRTLGVRLSPSGQTEQVVAHLRNQSIEFAINVASSSFTRTDAYWAFLQYYSPQVGFSMPTLSLNQKQCSSIQSPAICAVLSKLHLNQHTSRAVVFGPSDYGGLDLPEL